MRREDVYILNTVKCRPPGNRNPLDEEVANCREYFEQQLEILQPDFICALGAVAARALLDSRDSISRMRGRFYRWRGSQVIVTYHPAYLLRTPEAKAKTWEDMKMLMKAMGVDL
jgi:DNA polymerase